MNIYVEKHSKCFYKKILLKHDLSIKNYSAVYNLTEPIFFEKGKFLLVNDWHDQIKIVKKNKFFFKIFKMNKFYF